MADILHLNLKSEYFYDIKNGRKPYEYRLDNEYWRKRLLNRDFTEVHFKCGYPSRSDSSKIIKKKYIGYEMKDIKHKHFGNDGKDDAPVRVFAIRTYGENL